MKKLLKNLVINLNLLVFLPGYILLIVVMALSEKEQLSPAIDHTFISIIDQPIQTIKTLWKIIIIAIQ